MKNTQPYKSIVNMVKYIYASMLAALKTLWKKKIRAFSLKNKKQHHANGEKEKNTIQSTIKTKREFAID